MYFGFKQSQTWCEQVATTLSHPRYQPWLADITLFTFPSAPAISEAIDAFAGTPMAVGVQNICAEPPGPWTGETSAAMVREMGGDYVEIGHAERRNDFHETPLLVARKVKMAMHHGLTPVVCIGGQQPLSAEDSAKAAIHQAQMLLQMLGHFPHRSTDIIFAWEPQWAIGAENAANIEDIRFVCRTLRDYLQRRYPLLTRVIYGGSAGPGLLKCLWPDVDGLFLGRHVHHPTGFQLVLDEAVNLLAQPQTAT
jgi:triosephosphate isomerase